MVHGVAAHFSSLLMRTFAPGGVVLVVTAAAATVVVSVEPVGLGFFLRAWLMKNTAAPMAMTAPRTPPMRSARFALGADLGCEGGGGCFATGGGAVTGGGATTGG